MTFRLHMLGGHSERFSERYYRSLFGLSLPECRIIGITGGLEAATFKTVCELANLEKSYASRIINRLVEQNLIAKSENPMDQRSVLLSLTEKGGELHGNLHAASEALNRRMLKVLSAEQQTTFMTCLVLLQEQLNEMEEHGDPVGEYIRLKDSMPAAEAELPQPREEAVIDLATVRQLYHALDRIMRNGNSGEV